MATEKILLVDDDPTILDLMNRFLARQGYGIAIANTGQQALAAIQKDNFHLAILDLRLPDYSGLELLSCVKAQSPETEVILFTGHGGLDSALKALRLGAYDYLVKSELRWPDLQAVVSRALERRSLAQRNRELLENLQQAQKELAKRRAGELAQIRRLGEALARPLTSDQLFEGLLKLIWESLPLEVLGLQFQTKTGTFLWQGYRKSPHIPQLALQEFQDWLQHQLHDGLHMLSGGSPESSHNLWDILWEKIQARDIVGVVVAARHRSFAPEESELFRIFSLQGEAALKNLQLFEEVKSLAIRDGLTGLYNHRHFWELLGREVETSRRYNQPLSLLFLDIDDFKSLFAILCG